MRSNETIDTIVAELRRLIPLSELGSVLQAGRVIVTAIYGGDIAASRKRGPKRSSVNTIARHPGSPLTATTLRRCLAIYRLSVLVPALGTSPALTLRHARLVLGLPQDDGVALLLSSATGRWSAERLAAEVVRTWRPSKRRRSLRRFGMHAPTRALSDNQGRSVAKGSLARGRVSRPWRDDPVAALDSGTNRVRNSPAATAQLRQIHHRWNIAISL